MRVLVLNAGSRTLKASLVVDGEAIARAQVPATDADPGLAALLGQLPLDQPVDAIAHRLVHGGDRFTAPVVVDGAVLDTLRGLADLAPLHLPPALRVLGEGMARFPDVPHVCCFDTAFHVTLPEAETRYPVPDRWASEWRIRRFGFHGLSVEWAVMRAGELLGRPPGEALPRRRPSRRRLLGDRGRRRPLCPDIHGLHAPRRSDDGHQVRLGGPGDAPDAAAYRQAGCRGTGR